MRTGRPAKWQILLTEFNIVYVTRTTMKAQALADHIAENPIDDDYEPLKTYFPDKKVLCIDEVIIDVDPGWKVHGDLIHAPPAELQTISAPCSFIAWGMDVIGSIEPKASNGHRFILLAIDYFTNWVAKTFKSMTKKAVVAFVHVSIICRFGIPKVIVTDNAANLNSHLMQEVCQQFKIAYQNFTPYHPKANGVVETANKNIKKILRKMIQGSRQWHEKLPCALLGYHTTIHTSTGVTLYLLVYGTEAVVSAKVKIPSLRIVVEVEIDDD
ncbi:uncharacterized protein K02A2.6-like [Capsicum annuum]|uniref:uncharacterized protein K02A2.6-like n=1 Tax=Capsicum annuum TaxID=4072 RepID=UPI001FB0DA4D|nr:uncharacterized protein K02A2.6-like [Capsicum annuum]